MTGLLKSALRHGLILLAASPLWMLIVFLEFRAIRLGYKRACDALCVLEVAYIVLVAFFSAVMIGD